MDDRQLVHRIDIINEHMVEVFHNFQEVCDPVQTNVNIFIACFMTSYARLKLYDALDTLKERVLYMDTGSIIYTKNLQKLQFLSATISVNSSLLLPNLRTTPTTPSKENKPVKSEDSPSMNENKKS